MNKLDQEEIKKILASCHTLTAKIEEAAGFVDNINSGLPDFITLQQNDETASVGYRIEDIETALANASQELADASKYIVRLERHLGLLGK
jgi:hypothetical protein